MKVRSRSGHDPTDLDWLRAWGEGIDRMVNNPDYRPGGGDWAVFRPDDLARDAMIRFGGRFPEVIAQVREYLDHAEWAFTDLCRVLPPYGCPQCGSDAYYKDITNRRPHFRHCWICGKQTELPNPLPHEKEGAAEGFSTALENLRRVIFTATDAIGESTQSSKAREWSTTKPPTWWRRAVFDLSPRTWTNKRKDLESQGSIHPDSTSKKVRIDLNDLTAEERGRYDAAMKK